MIAPEAVARDAAEAIPDATYDLAFLMKSLPCLEQVDSTIGRALLETTPAKRLVVSFPTRSLGGHAKGMPARYEEHLRQLVSGRPRQLERFDFSTELVFVLHD